MSKRQDEYRALRRLEREINELGRLRLRSKRLRVKPVVSNDKDLAKFAKSWASRCARPLQDYCRGVLMQLGRYFTQASIGSVLSEAQSRGLSIEAVIILLSQCNLVQCDDRLIRYYLDTGKVDVNQLLQTLRNQGITISLEELKSIVEGSHKGHKATSKGKPSLFQRLIRH